MFFDEVDAMARSRETDNGKNDASLNQILLELNNYNDGESNVVVLCATNVPNSLDDALVRR